MKIGVTFVKRDDNILPYDDNGIRQTKRREQAALAKSVQLPYVVFLLQFFFIYSLP